MCQKYYGIKTIDEIFLLSVSKYYGIKHSFSRILLGALNVLLINKCVFTGSRCEHKFLGSQRRSGFFSSPQVGAPFPADLICKYIFQGEERDRVQIIFVNLSFSETNKDAIR